MNTRVKNSVQKSSAKAGRIRLVTSSTSSSHGMTFRSGSDEVDNSVG